MLHHFLLGQLDEPAYIEEFVYNYGEWSRGLAVDLWRARASSGSDTRYFAYPMLRRLAGSPVPPENFVYAAIDPQKLGSEQASPIEPDEIWPEAPSDWVPPSRRSD